MTRDAWIYLLAYALVFSMCVNALLGAAVFVLAWLYPNANKAWLPKRLREPPAHLKGLVKP